MPILEPTDADLTESTAALPGQPDSAAELASATTAAPARTGVDIGIIMGSDSDWTVMQAARDALSQLGLGDRLEVEVVSAHRTPDKLVAYGRGAAARGLKVIIAGAGGAAHLPGMIASLTTLPVIGVPVPLKTLDGLDSLLSIVQMPAGIPVATVSIGGAANAGLLAARILGATDPDVAARLDRYTASLVDTVNAKNEALQRRVADEARESR